MTNSCIKQYKARRALEEKVKNKARSSLSLVQTDHSTLPNAHEAEQTKRLRAVLQQSAVVSSRAVDTDAVEARIAQLGADFDRQHFDRLFANASKQTLTAIAAPFGIGAVVSAFDKVGGNVDTVHNAREGVYASDAEHQRYEKRGEYDSASYHSHENYKATNRKNSKAAQDGTLIDAYTGNQFRPEDRHHEQNKPTLDHIVAAKNVHDDPGRVLAEMDGPSLANVDANLAPTSKTINSAKKTRTAEEFKQQLESKSSVRRERINDLESRLSSLNDQERKELAKEKNLESVDIKRLEEEEIAAKTEIDRLINRQYYSSGKFVRNTLSAGTTEGFKMGAQQAFGSVLVEFIAGVFVEVDHWRKHGRTENSLFAELQKRLMRVAARCEKNLETALSSFGQGFISGFFSSLVTTLINAFVTTGKRLVRIVREGLYSLMQAARLLLLQPDGMTFEQAAHEASKVLVTGGIVVGGIAVEQWAEQQMSLFPFLASVSGPVAAAIVSAIVALASGLAVYLLDKADLFNVNADLRLKAIDNALQSSIEEREARIAGLLENL